MQRSWPTIWCLLPSAETLEHVCADVQKQLKAAQEQLSKAEQSRAAEAERWHQTESKLAAELKQAKLDLQQVLTIASKTTKADSHPCSLDRMIRILSS